MDNSKCHKCEKEFVESDNIVYCPTCEAYHHLECWERNGGCGNPQCKDYVKKEFIARPAPTMQSTHSNLQEQPSPQPKEEEPKKKMSKKMIFLIASIASIVVGVPFIFFESFGLYVLSAIGMFLAFFGVIGLFGVSIAYMVKFLKRSNELKKEAQDSNYSAEAVKKTYKTAIFPCVFMSVLIIGIIIVSIVTRPKMERFEKNLGSSYSIDELSSREIDNLAETLWLDADDYDVKAVTEAKNRSTKCVVIIIECGSKKMANELLSDSDYIIKALEKSYPSYYSFNSYRDGKFVLIGETSAISDALN